MKRKIIVASALSVLLVVMLFSQDILAASFRVATIFGTSYFEAYQTNGWADLSTPQHYLMDTSPQQIAYCLQHRKTSPSSSTTYTDIDILSGYSPITLSGLMIILENGYPYVTPGGLSADEARYATANAIRFWLSEREFYEGGRDDFYNFTDLHMYTDDQLRALAPSGTIGSKIRANLRPSDNDVLQYAVNLLIQARSQAAIPHAVSFSPSSLSMSQSGSYFVGSTTVSVTNCQGGYTLNTGSLPAGSWVSGYTGNAGDVLTFYIPVSAANGGKSFSLSVSGFDDRTRSNMFAYRPTSSTYQAVVTVTIGKPYMTQAYNGNLTLTTPAYPDLTITSLTTDKSVYEPGETVTVNATVLNQSTVGSGAFNVRLRSDTLGEMNWVRWGSLGAGATGSYTYQFSAPSNFSVDTAIVLDFYADASFEIQEYNEGNNQAFRTITVKAGKPDLTVTALSTDKSVYEAGETVTVTATVKNIGNTTAGSSVLRLSPAGLSVQDRTLSSLAANAVRSLTYTFVAPNNLSAGTIIVTALADATNIVTESNENNNSRSITVNLNAVKPDLTITDDTITNYYAGKDVVISAKISNLSPQPVPSVKIKMTITSSSGSVSPLVYEESIPVPGNASNLAVFRVKVPSVSGNYSIRLQADSDNQISESNEANNERIKTSTVSQDNRISVPDPDAESLQQTFISNGKKLPALTVPSSSTYHTWQEYRLENGKYVLKNYWMRLTVVLAADPDSRIAIKDKPDQIESGFGISITEASTVTTNYDRPEKLVGTQMVWLFYPETLYGSPPYLRVADAMSIASGDLGDKINSWKYPASPYSSIGSRLHFTPLWIPDGTYTILAQAFYAWSPVGQVYSYQSNSVNIVGDMYDRVTVVRR